MFEKAENSKQSHEIGVTAAKYLYRCMHEEFPEVPPERESGLYCKMGIS